MDFEAVARILAHNLRKNKTLKYSNNFDSKKGVSPNDQAFWLNKAIQCLANAAAAASHKRLPVEKFEIESPQGEDAMQLVATLRSENDFLWQSNETALSKKIFDGDRNCFIDCTTAWCAVNNPDDGGHFVPPRKTLKTT